MALRWFTFFFLLLCVGKSGVGRASFRELCATMAQPLLRALEKQRATLIGRWRDKNFTWQGVPLRHGRRDERFMENQGTGTLHSRN